MKVKLPKRYIEILVIIGLGIALLFAAVAITLAWYTSQSKVDVAQTVLTSENADSLDVSVPEASVEYDRYMGQTGTEFNGNDSPYTLKYSPVYMTGNFYNNTENNYLMLYFTNKSYVDFIVPTQEDELLDNEALFDNFTIRLVLMEVNSTTNELEETTTKYRPDNGYLRDCATNSLVRLESGKQYAFAMYIYFQGEVGYQLLQSTSANISSKYKFDYSDETYMFATFHLFTLFEINSLHTLTFDSLGYDEGYSQLDGSKYSGISVGMMLCTGGSLLDENGNERDYPVPELVLNTNTDFSFYFEDWFAFYYDKEIDDSVPNIYRKELVTNNSDIYTLETKPLSGKMNTMHAKWGKSNNAVFDLNYEPSVDINAPVRPKAHYSESGYLSYDPISKIVKVYNPTASGTIVSQEILPPTRSGYAFVGWATRENATYNTSTGVMSYPAFTTGNQNKITVTSSEIKLYAVWARAYDLQFIVNETWGNNYAKASGNLMLGEHQIEFDGSSYTLAVSAQADLYTSANVYTIANGFVDRTTGNDENLVFGGWKYQNSSGEWVTLSSQNTFAINDDVTLYPIWTNRATYTITLDMYQEWRLLGVTYWLYGKLDVGAVTNIDGYTIKFNNATTGQFSSANQANVLISNIPEGTALLDIIDGEMNKVVPENVKTGILSRYSLEIYTLSNNNNTQSFNGWNPTEYTGTAAITSNITVYVKYKE